MTPDDDPGEPIAALSGLRHEARPGFLDRVRLKIQRRHFASHVVDFAWSGPALVLVQFLEMIFSAFSKKAEGGGGPDPWNRPE
jgi:hypothetical protein